jgi:hypothetical protein
MHVGFATLAGLARMYRTMKEYLFERNIRSGLSIDKPANRAIKNAETEFGAIPQRISKMPPETFWNFGLKHRSCFKGEDRRGIRNRLQ